MEITDIAVNPQNLSEWSFSTEPVDLGIATFSARLLKPQAYNDCLTAHLTLNNFLDDQLGGTEDWGSKYANWLNSMGFDHQSDDGWWNLIAVTPGNIRAFIKFWDDDEYQAVVLAATERYNRKKFKHDFTLVSDFVEVLG